MNFQPMRWIPTRNIALQSSYHGGELYPSDLARTTSQFLSGLWHLITRGNSMARGVSSLVVLWAFVRKGRGPGQVFQVQAPPVVQGIVPVDNDGFALEFGNHPQEQQHSQHSRQQQRRIRGVFGQQGMLQGYHSGRHHPVPPRRRIPCPGKNVQFLGHVGNGVFGVWTKWLCRSY
jgi:hypothetical protein